MPIVLDPSPSASFTELLLGALDPWMTDDLQTYAIALGAMFEQVYALAVDRGTDGEEDYVPGWGALLDPGSCPTAYLPYLGQYVGVGNLAGVPDATARALITSRPRFRRGTPGAIAASAQATLTGSQQVVLTERYGGAAYALRVLTFAAETPSQPLTLQAILAVKPAGIVLSYDVVIGWSVGDLEDRYTGQTISALEGAYATLTDFEAQVS